MKTKLKTTILLLAFLNAFSCKEKTVENSYQQYVPQVFNGDELVELPKMMTEKHKENVIQVLKYYGEKWKVENGKLLVSEKIDNEILWNYTTKANDTVWLREHRTK